MDYIKVTEFPINIEELNGKSFFITSNNVNEVTHIYHKYPAKFIPQIPRWGIKFAQEKPLLVIDPFCGSGTTNLEAFRFGNYTIGFDIDPLAIFISKAKTTIISPSKLAKAQLFLVSSIKNYSFKEKYPIPNVENLPHWFTEDAVKKLAFIKKTILDKFDSDVKDFLLLIFSSIIREVSNADNQTQKTYVSHTLIKTPPEVFTFFIKRLQLYIDRMIQLQSETKGIKRHKPSYIKVDSRKDLSNYLRNFDGKLSRIIITSPPYGKAIDYIYNQMLEYFWLGDLLGIGERKQLNEYKRNYIGTKQIYSTEYQKFQYKSLDVLELDKLIKVILKKDKKHAYITYQYFFSMKENLKKALKILRKGERYIMVVGITTVSGYTVNTAGLLSQLAEDVGYKIEGNFSYKIRNRYMRFDRKGKGGIIEDDHVLIFAHK